MGRREEKDDDEYRILGFEPGMSSISMMMMTTDLTQLDSSRYIFDIFDSLHTPDIGTVYNKKYISLSILIFRYIYILLLLYTWVKF